MELNYFREDRPWGYYRILIETPNYKVKEMVIRPSQRVSYQLHHKRSEHWFVVQGEATVTRDDQEVVLKTGESVNLPVGTKHRVANQGSEDLIFVEVQTGTYFGEDDIVRLGDDYNRV